MLNKKNYGFTIIELLVVISVIGVLAGVTINAIDGQRQQQYAQDSSKKTNLEKTCAGIKAYHEGEGSYPLEGDENNPLHSSAATANVMKIYINNWPADFFYDVAGNDFSIYVQKAVDNNFFKCGSAWRKVQECYETTNNNNVTECVALP